MVVAVLVTALVAAAVYFCLRYYRREQARDAVRSKVGLFEVKLTPPQGLFGAHFEHTI